MFHRVSKSYLCQSPSHFNDFGLFLGAMISLAGQVHAPHPNYLILFAGSSIML